LTTNRITISQVEAAYLGIRHVDITGTTPEGVLPQEAIALAYGFQDASYEYISLLLCLRLQDAIDKVRFLQGSVSGDATLLGYRLQFISIFAF
jgi:hypothetical protein